jgi:hypothetical protein
MYCVNNGAARDLSNYARNLAGREREPHALLGPSQVSQIKGDECPHTGLNTANKEIQSVQPISASQGCGGPHPLSGTGVAPICSVERLNVGWRCHSRRNARSPKMTSVRWVACSNPSLTQSPSSSRTERFRRSSIEVQVADIFDALPRAPEQPGGSN